MLLRKVPCHAADTRFVRISEPVPIAAGSNGWGQSLPDKGVKPLRYEMIAGHFDGIGDDLLDRGYLAPTSGFRQLVGDVDVFDLLVLRQDAQRSRIGGKLVIRVAEVGVFLIFQRQHGVELGFHLVLDFGVNFIEESGVV